MKDCPHRDEVTKFLKGTSQPIVFTDPFPPQQQMVVENPTPPKVGNAGRPPSGDASSSVLVLMCVETVNLTTRAKTYDSVLVKNIVGEGIDQLSSSTPLDNGSLHIDRPISTLVLRPPKSTVHKARFNPSSCTA